MEPRIIKTQAQYRRYLEEARRLVRRDPGPRTPAGERLELLAKLIDDYEIVADNLLSNAGRKWTDRISAYALYTDPPLGRLGMSEAEIRQKGIRALVGKRPMSRVARAVEKGETRGFLKIHVEEGSRRILGAALLGTSGDEAVHSLIDAVYSRTPAAEFQRRMRIHPNVSELLPTVLEDLKPL